MKKAALSLGVVAQLLFCGGVFSERRQTPTSGLAVAVACRDGCVVATDPRTYLPDDVVFSGVKAHPRPVHVRVFRGGAMTAASGAVVDFEALLSEFLDESCVGSRTSAPMDVLLGDNSGAGVEISSGKLVLGGEGAAKFDKKLLGPALGALGVASCRSGLSVEAFLHFCSNALHHIERYKAEKEPLELDLVAAGPRSNRGAGQRRFAVGRVNRKGAWTGQGETVVATGKDASEVLAFLRPRLGVDSTVEEAQTLILRCLNSRRRRVGGTSGQSLGVYMAVLEPHDAKRAEHALSNWEQIHRGGFMEGDLYVREILFLKESILG